MPLTPQEVAAIRERADKVSDYKYAPGIGLATFDMTRNKILNIDVPALCDEVLRLQAEIDDLFDRIDLQARGVLNSLRHAHKDKGQSFKCGCYDDPSGVSQVIAEETIRHLDKAKETVLRLRRALEWYTNAEDDRISRVAKLALAGEEFP